MRSLAQSWLASTTTSLNGKVDHDAWLTSQEFGHLPTCHRVCYGAIQAQLTAEQQADSDMAPLHMPIERMGEGVRNLQHDITVVLEDKVLVPKLQATMDALLRHDQVRVAHTHTSGEHLHISMSFVTAWLCRVRLTPSEWREMIARVLGLPSPACAPMVGRAIRGLSKEGRPGTYYGPVDLYGDNVFKAILPGDGWRKNHDYVKDIIASVASAAGYYVDVEIYKLFANQLSGANLDRIAEEYTKRKRHGMVPDLLLQAPVGATLTPDQILYELKTLNNKYDHDAPPGTSNGTENRAKRVFKDQVTTLTKLDKEVLNHTDSSTDGPMMRRLKSLNDRNLLSSENLLMSTNGFDS